MLLEAQCTRGNAVLSVYILESYNYYSTVSVHKRHTVTHNDK